MAINPFLLPLFEVGKIGREMTVPWTQPAADGCPGRLFFPCPPSPGEHLGDARRVFGQEPCSAKQEEDAASRGAQRARTEKMEKRVVNEAGSGARRRRRSSGRAGGRGGHDRAAIARFPDTGVEEDSSVLREEDGEKQHKRYSWAAIKQSHTQTETRSPGAATRGSISEGCAATPYLGYWAGGGGWRRDQQHLKTPRLPNSDRICSRRVRAD